MLHAHSLSTRPPRPTQLPLKAAGSELKTPHHEIRFVCGPSTSSDGSSVVWSDDSDGSDSSDEDGWDLQSRLLREVLDYRHASHALTARFQVLFTGQIFRGPHASPVAERNASIPIAPAAEVPPFLRCPWRQH
jgi:hypothetical protein